VHRNPPRFWGKQAAGILFLARNHALLLKRSQQVYDPGLWGIPGGAVRDGEPVAGTALREAEEEMRGLPSYELSEPRSFVWHAPDKASKFKYTTLVFELSEVPKRWHPILNWEHDDWRWFDIEEAKLHPVVHPGVKWVLRQL